MDCPSHSGPYVLPVHVIEGTTNKDDPAAEIANQRVPEGLGNMQTDLSSARILQWE